MFPAWLWLQDPKLRLLYSSYAQDLSIRDSLATRRLIDHRWYQERWGSKFSIALDQNEKGRFENNYKGYRLATSVGGQNTGEGGDILVCDDPHNVQEAESELKREGTVRWWNEVMSTRSNDPRTDRRVVIAQRAHFSDLSQDILDKGNYVHLNLPMEFEASISIPSGLVFEEAETKDPRKDDGALLWADRFDEGWVKQQKINMGMYAYASQMQQRPSPREGGMFKRDKIQFDTIPAEMRLDKGKDDAVWSWDCAFKDLEDSNFVVGQCWIRQGGNFYLLHQVRARMSFTATKKAIRACAQKWPTITRILVEDKANGTAVIDDLKNTIPGLWPVEPEGGKVSRASVVEPVWEAGNLFLPMNAPWAEDFIEECCEFDKGAYDDQVDAMSQALVYLLKRMYLPSAAEVTNITRSTLGFHKAKPYHDPRGD
jgi:predicted phage terminase large subunit-like protein